MQSILLYCSQMEYLLCHVLLSYVAVDVDQKLRPGSTLLAFLRSLYRSDGYECSPAGVRFVRAGAGVFSCVCTHLRLM